MLVSVIVPAYKQEKTIRHDILNIYKVLKQTNRRFEIIVVVDGLLDKTFEHAKKIKHSNVKVFAYAQNKGKGYAVRYGMARSKGDVVAFIDAGMEISANGLNMILEHMQWYNADVMVGSKRHPASKVRYPLVRRIYSIGYQVLVYLLFRLKIKDTQTGLKVFKREVLIDVLPRLVVKQYAFDIELLAVSMYLGYDKIYESPVEINFDGGTSRVSGLLIFDKVVQGMLLDTLAVFYRMNFLDYYHDKNKINWKYDKDLKIKVNI